MQFYGIDWNHATLNGENCAQYLMESSQDSTLCKSKKRSQRYYKDLSKTQMAMGWLCYKNIR